MTTFLPKIIARQQQGLSEKNFLALPNAPTKLSATTQAMRPGLMQVQAALGERQGRFDPLPLIKSPFTILFDVTLPALKATLLELGEERTEQIIDRLVDHGMQMIEMHGVTGAREHLEALYKDLSGYEAELRAAKGAENIISAYRRKDFENAIADYLRLALGEKIKKIQVDEQGMISLELNASATDSDLHYLRGAKKLLRLDLTGSQITDISILARLTSLWELELNGTQVTDFSILTQLVNLRFLNLVGSQVSDVSILAGLTCLNTLDLSYTQVSDLSPLAGLTNLFNLDLSNTPVFDLSALTGLKKLQLLGLGRTQASDQQIDDLRDALPDLEVMRSTF